MAKNRKKVVLLIVEGITDQISLELSVQKLINTNQRLEFEVVQGDLTVDKNIPRNRIKAELGKLVKDGKKRKYCPSDYQEVIHIIDLDGVYLKDSLVMEDASIDEVEYSDCGIKARNRKNIIERNKRKRAIIEELANTRVVNKIIKYRLFYFSGNLEHVLHNMINPKNNEKTRLAELFAKEYDEYDDQEATKFVEFICNSDFSSKLEYMESWKYIQSVKDKIIRHTNIDIFVKEYHNSKF